MWLYFTWLLGKAVILTSALAAREWAPGASPHQEVKSFRLHFADRLNIFPSFRLTVCSFFLPNSVCAMGP